MDSSVYHVHTVAEYEKLKQTREKLVVVDFSAEWCGPCVNFAPKFEKMAKMYEDVIFVHVDVDELEDMTDLSNVKVAPSFKFFKNGKLLLFLEGLNETKIREGILKYK